MHCGILWDGSLKLHFERLHFEMFKDKAPSLMEVSLTSEFLNSTICQYWWAIGGWLLAKICISLFLTTIKTVILTIMSDSMPLYTLTCLSLALVSAIINSQWPSDAICWCRSRSTLANVIAYCLTALSYNLNQSWLFIIRFCSHQLIAISRPVPKLLFSIGLTIILLKLLPHVQWVNQTWYKCSQHFTGTSYGQKFDMHFESAHYIDWVLRWSFDKKAVCHTDNHEDFHPYAKK